MIQLVFNSGLFQRNALDAMISEPSKVQDPMFIDDPSGNKQSIKGSGMAPNFVERKVQFLLLFVFGKTFCLIGFARLTKHGFRKLYRDYELRTLFDQNFETSLF